MGVVRKWWMCVCLLWSSAVVAGPFMSHPDVSVGSNPIRTFTGEVAHGDTQTLMTVPEGQDFIVTLFLEQSIHLELKRGDDVVVPRWALYQDYFHMGTSRAVIRGGSTVAVEHLEVSTPGTVTPFRLEGYLVASGSTPLSLHGERTGSSPIYVNDSGADFVIRTVLGSNIYCSLKVDGTKEYRALDFNRTSELAYNHRRGMIRVPAGSSVGFEPSPEVSLCKYYIEGDFVQP